MILNSDIASLLLVFDIVKHTMRQIRFNVAWAVCYNVIALTLAMGLVKPFHFNLTPYVLFSLRL